MSNSEYFNINRYFALKSFLNLMTQTTDLRVHVLMNILFFFKSYEYTFTIWKQTKKFKCTRLKRGKWVRAGIWLENAAQGVKAQSI